MSEWRKLGPMQRVVRGLAYLVCGGLVMLGFIAFVLIMFKFK